MTSSDMHSESLIFSKSAYNDKRHKVPQAEHEERLELKSKVANRFNLACKCCLNGVAAWLQASRRIRQSISLTGKEPIISQ